MQSLRKEKRQYTIEDRTGTEQDRDRAGQKKTDKKGHYQKMERTNREMMKQRQDKKKKTNKLTRRGQS